MIENLSKRELAKMYHQTDDKKLKSIISLKILELDKEENKNSEIIIEVGKTYETRNGNKIFITGRFLAVYRSKNLSKANSKDYKIKYPNYYIDGSRNKNKKTDLDIIREVKDVNTNNR